MARKSRRTVENIVQAEAAHSDIKRYPTAIYVRLSAEDDRKIDSESVENQIKFLRGFVEGKEDLFEADLYVDRGITGTKFDRPEFNRMIEDMKIGKFSCIVVRIFEERAYGKSFEKIAAGLNRDGIKSPGRYFYEKGFIKKEQFKNSLWANAYIREMLMNRVYIGDMVQGKTKQALYKNMPTTRVPVSDRICVEGTHEPIVSRELFDKVQEIFVRTGRAAAERKAKQEKIEKPENFFSKLVFCGECGHMITYRSFRRAHGKRAFGYVCPSARIFPGVCTHKFILKEDLDAIMEKVLSDHIKLYEATVEKLQKINMEDKRCFVECTSDIDGLKKELSAVESKSGRLYDDFADGLMSEKDYLFARNTYREKADQLRQAIEAKEAEVRHYAADYCGDSRMAEAFGSVKDLKILSSETAHALIDRIDFYGQGRIDVHFRFQSELDDFVNELMERQGESE